MKGPVLCQVLVSTSAHHDTLYLQDLQLYTVFKRVITKVNGKSLVLIFFFLIENFIFPMKQWITDYLFSFMGLQIVYKIY